MECSLLSCFKLLWASAMRETSRDFKDKKNSILGQLTSPVPFLYYYYCFCWYFFFSFFISSVVVVFACTISFIDNVKEFHLTWIIFCIFRYSRPPDICRDWIVNFMLFAESCMSWYNIAMWKMDFNNLNDKIIL